MRVAACSSERLFLDGLVAILESNPSLQVVTASTSIRECLAGAGLDASGALVFDSRRVTERDIDFLIGAQIFGRFRVVTIGDKAVEGFEQLTLDQPAADLLKLLRVSPRRTAPRELGTNPDGTPQQRRRGRPVIRQVASLPLAPREYQAARLIADGRTNREIAEIMNLREQSAKNLAHVIARKLNCANRVQVANAIVEALKNPG